MDNQKIETYREMVKQFFDKNEKRLSFVVDCSLKDRVRFVDQVIFPGWAKYRFYGRFFLSRLAYFTDYSPLKVFIYRRIGIKIGKGVFIAPDVTIDVHFPKLIQIDDYVILGYGSSIFVHDFSNNKYRMGQVHIGKGAIIGGYSFIRCGVHIGEQANVELKATVLRDVPDFYKQPQILKIDD